MARTKTSWKKGKSGNPRGRPPKARSLTRLLEACGETPLVIEGKTLARKEALAERVWELVTTGKVTLGKSVLEATSVAEWLAVVRWIYSHIDGPPHPTGDNEDNELVVKVVRGTPNGKKGITRG